MNGVEKVPNEISTLVSKRGGNNSDIRASNGQSKFLRLDVGAD